ncbi:DUF4129 domain-containing protein [Chloroflexi bacterium TSY]|nr:DUF4129 domain-containing protein [Chloroflexi bacterium TSY]
MSLFHTTSVSLAIAQSDAVDENQELSLIEYRALLADVIEILDAPNESQSDVQRLELAQQMLNTVKRVKLSSGMTIHPEPLITNERIDPAEDIEIARSRVRLVAQQLESAQNDQTYTRLALLQEVFERPEFNRPPTLRERFFNWLDEQLDRFFPERGVGLRNTGLTRTLLEIIGWLLAIVGVGLVAAMLIYWFRGITGSFVQNFNLQIDDSRGDHLPLTSQEARERASSLAQVGNYRQAVRQLYLSALLLLEENGAIRHDRSLTNREVLNRIQEQQPVRDHLRPVVETFDDVWYGIREPDRNTFDNYQREIDHLSQVVDDQQESVNPH